MDSSSAEKKEVEENLKNILSENKWEEITLLDQNLTAFSKNSEFKTIKELESNVPVFTTCEHLIADNGDILFSSCQLKST